MKRRFRISYWLAVFFSLGFLMVPATWVGAQVPNGIFVHILNPPIAGESTGAGHVGWIDATSYSDGVLNGGSALFSGIMRSDFRPVQITKFLDKSSPKLYQAAAQGTRIQHCDD